MSEYEKEHKERQAAIKRTITTAAKEEPTKILKSEAKEMNFEQKKETQYFCSLARTLFHEGMQQYEEGDMKFDEFIEDLYKSLKAIAKSKPPTGTSKSGGDVGLY